MSVPIDTACLECLLGRHLRAARELGTEEQATAFAKDLMALLAEAPAEASSPWFGPGIAALFDRHYHLGPDRFAKEKADSNAYVLARLPRLRALVEAAEDPVLAGLKLSILGNYLDFSALYGEVRFEKLDEMLRSALEMELDGACYARFLTELAGAKELLYLTDNAGEIGFDRVLAEAIQARFPGLAITFCVRGGPAQNDATRADAAQVGIPFPVIDSGSNIAGTVPELLGEEAAAAFRRADVVLAKGQGNAETLLGCGRRVYYAFLVKCARFVRRCGVPKFTPVFSDCLD